MEVEVKRPERFVMESTNDREMGRCMDVSFRLLLGAREDNRRMEEMTPNLLMTSLSEGLREPLQTLVKTISGGSTGGLDVLLKLAGDKTPGKDIKLTQARCLKLWRPNLSVISAAFMAFCYLISQVLADFGY